MSDLQKCGRTDPPSPSDFPIGSAESRAAARAVAEARFMPMPDIIASCLEPVLDADGQHIYGGQPCDSVRARVDYGEQTTYYDRNPGESLKAFQDRVLGIHPRGRFARSVILIPTESGHSAARYPSPPRERCRPAAKTREGRASYAESRGE